MLEEVRGYREKRNMEMVSKLADVTGLGVTYESLEDSVDGSLGRPHLADILIEEGFVDSVSEAFDEYLAEGGDVYVPMERAPYDEVIDAVHEAGGVASLAHPGRIRSDEVPEMVEELSENGLDAIEVWYPYGEIRSEEYAEIGVDDASRIAEEHGLLKTGGSDCHGPGSGKFRIGEIRVSKDGFSELGELRDRAHKP
jgi:predicted metal-dependent phosphoesterase TrpH